MSDLGALAEAALAATPAADGVLVTATRERSLTLRFALSRPTQATAVDDVAVTVAAVRAGHVGTAATNVADPEALAACGRAAVAAAEAAARAAAGPGAYPGFPAPRAAPVHHGWDAATAELDPAAGGAALAAAFDACRAHSVDAHGIWTAAEVETALRSANGVRAADRVTDAFMKVTAIAPSGRSGWASSTAIASGALEPAELAGRAAAKATGAFAAGAAPVRVPPGEYTAVLEPAAVGELLAWLGWTAFNGLAHAEGRGALDGRLGTRVAGPAINLSDSPRYPATLPRAFDAEGVPKAPIPLIQDGVAQAVVHDTRSAARAGARSTGHALAPGGGGHGPLPTNLVLVGGGAADEAELCAGVERGIYVTRLWYVNAVRAKETLLTGVTRDGTFLIEDGQVTRPVEDLRFTDSVLRLLSHAEELTAAPRLVSEGEFYGRRFATGVVAPALRVAGMRFG